MINRDNFSVLDDEEKAKYKFQFCERCSFYECELIEEYMQFKENNGRKDDSIEAIVQTVTFSRFIPENDDSPYEYTGAELIQAKEQADSKTNVFSYDEEELKNGCFMRKFAQVDCGRKRVAEGIGDNFKIAIRSNLKIAKDSDDRLPEVHDKWEPKQPIFVSAQTGQGKNYFVENTLLPYVRELNLQNRTDQKVLIISNRIALRLQIEDRLKGRGAQDIEQDAAYSYGDCATVMSYQSLLNQVAYLSKVQEEKRSRYIFVVCDEAHFFTSDAMFNPDTEKILYAVVNTFQDAIRIYMTATPYECVRYIQDYERWTYSVFYHFKRDYSYLDVRYYSAFVELKDVIVRTGNEKWLIFIDNKEKCKKFKEELEELDVLKGKVFTVRSESKNEEKYQKMVESERFGEDTKVLIATSVIDNGVNFRGIKNIVVSDMSKVKCLQMVGRARVNHTDDRMVLYIKRFDVKHVEKRIDDLKRQQDAYHEYDLAYNPAYDSSQTLKRNNYKEEFLNKYYHGATEDWQNAKHWFGRDRNDLERVYPNVIARSLADRLVLTYQCVLDEMRKTDEGQELSGQRYLEHQLSWFGKTYERENDITLVGHDKTKADFVDFLESYVANGGQILKEDQDKFCEKFTILWDLAFQREDKNLGRAYSIKKMNTLLQKNNLGYKIESNRETAGDKKTFWIVVRLIEN